jgi:NAD(P)-dependent dehydrogenase (short-subunit alcohol dehydrogenase family)
VELHLAGKVAVVTGASRGIGLATTRALAAEGVRVVAAARDTEGELGRAAGSAAPGEVRPFRVDLSDVDGPRRLIDAAATMHGGIDILVNNVGGVARRSDGFLSITDEDWNWGLAMNLLIPVRTTRAAVPHLLRSGAGAIVNVSSVMAYQPDPDVYDYTAGKAALTNFSKALSMEFGPQGLRVNTVSPGPTLTGMWTAEDGILSAVKAATGIDGDAFVKEISSRTAAGRFSRPEEVADLILLLASDRAGNVLGADFAIDGGLVTTT